VFLLTNSGDKMNFGLANSDDYMNNGLKNWGDHMRRDSEVKRLSFIYVGSGHQGQLRTVVV
jgi:hypothetical protein